MAGPRYRARPRQRNGVGVQRVRVLRNLEQAPAGSVGTVVRDLGVMEMALIEVDGATLLVKRGRDVEPLNGASSNGAGSMEHDSRR